MKIFMVILLLLVGCNSKKGKRIRSFNYNQLHSEENSLSSQKPNGPFKILSFRNLTAGMAIDDKDNIQTVYTIKEGQGSLVVKENEVLRDLIVKSMAHKRIKGNFLNFSSYSDMDGFYYLSRWTDHNYISFVERFREVLKERQIVKRSGFISFTVNIESFSKNAFNNFEFSLGFIDSDKYIEIAKDTIIKPAFRRRNNIHEVTIKVADLNAYDLYTMLNKRRELLFKVNYSKKTERAQKIIVSTPEKTEVYFENNFSVKSFLEKNFEDVEYNDREINYLLGFENYKYDFDDQGTAGKWEIMEHIIAYATYKEMTSSVRTKERVLSEYILIKELDILDVEAGDILEVRISGRKVTPKFSTIERHMNVRFGNGDFGTCVAYHKNETNPHYEKISVENSNFRLKINKKEYLLDDSLFLNNKVAYLGDGSAVFKFLVTREILGGDDSVKLIAKESEHSFKETIGFMGWVEGRCEMSKDANFKAVDYKIKTYQKEFRESEEFNLSVNLLKVMRMKDHQKEL